MTVGFDDWLDWAVVNDIHPEVVGYLSFAKQDLFDQAQEVIEHNWNHFYNGGFEAILWAELQGMLNEIKSYSGSNT
jgi:hypothetical protein